MSLVDKTIEVRRGNVYLTIASELADRYVAKGFDIVDTEGNVIKQSVPNDIQTLKASYEAHIQEIKDLKQEIKDLKTQLRESATPKEAKTTKKTSKKS